MKAFNMKTLNKLKNHKWKIGIFAMIFVAVFLFFSNPVYASTFTWLVGGIAQAIVSVLGLILTQVIAVLVKVAQYNNFIKEGPVTNGWVIVRDIANMFFVVILLVIAFATILRIERYNYKKWLPKLLMMAVLINFSKTICGLLIDAAQVVMLTFVAAFAPIAGGNLVEILGIAGWNKMSGDIEVNNWTVAGLYVLSVIYVVISLIVIVAMLAMLIMRMVMIWIYVVLSPLAFLLSSFPDGAKYASQWWSEFTKNLIIGPVLAFFIWLSFTSLVSFDQNNPDLITNIDSAGVNVSAYANETAVPETTQSLMIKFIIGIGMLIGGMTVAQSIGGAAAGAAGKVFNKGKGLALMGAGAVGGFALARAKGAGRTIKDTAVSGIARSSGLQNVLGKVGGSNVPVLNDLAAKTQLKLANVDRKYTEKAQKYVGSINDTRVLNRMANEKKYGIQNITPWQREVQNAARAKTGFYLDKEGKNPTLANMNRDQFTRLNSKSLAELGKQGIDPNSNLEFGDYLKTNRAARRAYNEGVLDKLMTEGGNPAEAGFIRGLDKDGKANNDLGFSSEILNYEDIETQGNVDRDGVGASSKIFDAWKNQTRNVRKGRAGENKIGHEEGEKNKNAKEINAFKYSKKSEKEKVEKILKQNTVTSVAEKTRLNPRGSGALAINELAKGQSNTVAVDFEKLNLSNLDKDGAADFRNIQGINTSDAGKIKEISSKMVGIIDQELETLRAKSSLNVGEQKRVENLEAAKVKFSAPEKIDNLSAVNSSAADYKISDVKKAKIHEELHGLGYSDEEEVHAATKNIVENRDYGNRYNAKELNKMMPESARQIRSTSGPKPVDDILKEEASQPVDVKVNVEVDSANINKTLEDFSKKVESFSKGFKKPSLGDSRRDSGMSTPYNFNYLFNNLRKSIEKGSNSTMSKLSQLGAKEAKNPLEMDVIVNSLEDKLN